MDVILKFASLCLLSLLVTCKSVSHQSSDLDGFMDLFGPKPDNIACGPSKTWYFHWMNHWNAKIWLEKVGAKPLPQEQKLMMRSESWKSPNMNLIDSIVEATNILPTVAGPGIYLSARPIGSMEYGDLVFIFRISSRDGKGLGCVFDKDFLTKNSYPRAMGKDRAGMPLLVMYRSPSSMDNWYIMPRAPDLNRDEQVQFDWPHQGDDKLIADEMVSGQTREQLLTNVYALGVPYTDFGSEKQQKLLLADLCAQTPGTISRDFLKDFFCHAVPERLSQKLASYPSTPLSFTEKGLVSKMEDIFGAPGMKVPKMMDIIKSLRSAN